MKSGIKTTEFWMTAAVNVASAIIAVLAARGMIVQEQAELYVVLAQSIAVAVAPIVMAIVSGQYIQSRAMVKSSNGTTG